DCRVVLVTVQPDVAVRCDGDPAQAKLALAQSVNRLGEVDRREQRLLDQSIVGRRGALPRGEARGEYDKGGSRQYCDTKQLSHHGLSFGRSVVKSRPLVGFFGIPLRNGRA